MLKYVLACLLVMHGLAHVSGVLGLWSSGPQAFPDQPWLLSKGVLSHSTLGRAWGAMWVAAVIGLVAAGIGLLLGRSWWPPVVVAGAAVSLLAILPWLRVVPPGAWAGALLDLLVVALLLSPLGGRMVEALT